MNGSRMLASLVYAGRQNLFAVYGFHLDDLVPEPAVKRGRICDIGDPRWVDAYKGIQPHLRCTGARCIGLGIDEGDTTTPMRHISTLSQTKGRKVG